MKPPNQTLTKTKAVVPLQACWQQCLAAENSLLLIKHCLCVTSCHHVPLLPTPPSPQLTLLSLLCWTLLISPAFTYWRFPGLGLWTFPLHLYSLPKGGLPSPELDHPLHIVHSQTGIPKLHSQTPGFYTQLPTHPLNLDAELNGSLRPRRPKAESGISPQTPQPPLPIASPPLVSGAGGLLHGWSSMNPSPWNSHP